MVALTRHACVLPTGPQRLLKRTRIGPCNPDCPTAKNTAVVYILVFCAISLIFTTALLIRLIIKVAGWGSEFRLLTVGVILKTCTLNSRRRGKAPRVLFAEGYTKSKNHSDLTRPLFPPISRIPIAVSDERTNAPPSCTNAGDAIGAMLLGRLPQVIGKSENSSSSDYLCTWSKTSRPNVLHVKLLFGVLKLGVFVHQVSRYFEEEADDVWSAKITVSYSLVNSHSKKTTRPFWRSELAAQLRDSYGRSERFLLFSPDIFLHFILYQVLYRMGPALFSGKRDRGMKILGDLIYTPMRMCSLIINYYTYY